jgi:hypothetical protein
VACFVLIENLKAGVGCEDAAKELLPKLSENAQFPVGRRVMKFGFHNASIGEK